MVRRSVGLHGLVDFIQKETCSPYEPYSYAVNREPIGRAGQLRFDLTEHNNRTFDVYKDNGFYKILVNLHQARGSNIEDEYRVHVDENDNYTLVERKRNIAAVQDSILHELKDSEIIQEEDEIRFIETEPRKLINLGSVLWKGQVYVNEEPTYNFTIRQDSTKDKWIARVSQRRTQILREVFEEYTTLFSEEEIKDYYSENQSIWVDRSNREDAVIVEIGSILGHDFEVGESEHFGKKTVFSYSDGVDYEILRSKKFSVAGTAEKYEITVKGFKDRIIHNVNKSGDLDSIIQSRLLECSGIDTPETYFFEIDLNLREGKTYLGNTRKKTDLSDIQQYALEIISRKTQGGFGEQAQFSFNELDVKRRGTSYNLHAQENGKERDYEIRIWKTVFGNWKCAISGPNFTEEGLEKIYSFDGEVDYSRTNNARFVEHSLEDRLRTFRRIDEATRFSPEQFVLATGNQSYLYTGGLPSYERARVTQDAMPVKKDQSRTAKMFDKMWYGGFLELYRLMGPGGKMPSLLDLFITGFTTSQGNNIMANVVAALIMKEFGADYMYTIGAVFLLRGLSIASYKVSNVIARDNISSFNPQEKWGELMNKELEVHFPLQDRADVNSWQYFENQFFHLLDQESKVDSTLSLEDVTLGYLQHKNTLHEIVTDTQLNIPERFEKFNHIFNEIGLHNGFYRGLEKTITLLESLDEAQIRENYVRWCKVQRSSGFMIEEYQNDDEETNDKFYEWADEFYDGLVGRVEDPSSRKNLHTTTESLDGLVQSFKQNVRLENDEELHAMAENSMEMLQKARKADMTNTAWQTIPLFKYAGLYFPFPVFFGWHICSRIYQGVVGPYTTSAMQAMIHNVARSSRKGASAGEFPLRMGVFQTTQNVGYFFGDVLAAVAIFSQKAMEKLYQKPVPQEVSEKFNSLIEEVGKNPEEYQGFIESLYKVESIVPLTPYFALFGLGLGLACYGHWRYFRFQRQLRKDLGMAE